MQAVQVGWAVPGCGDHPGTDTCVSVSIPDYGQGPGQSTESVLDTSQ